MFNEREQPTGEAFVEFASSDDRERAMTKDRQHMGGRYAAPCRTLPHPAAPPCRATLHSLTSPAHPCTHPMHPPLHTPLHTPLNTACTG